MFDLILIVVDRYTKIAVYITTTKRYISAELTSLLEERVIIRFRVPEGIVLDRGSVFTSTF